MALKEPMRVDRRNLLVALLAIAGWTAGSALADDDEEHDRGRRRSHREDDDHDHDAAVRARSAGEILPLTDIIEHVRRIHQGEVVGVELERKNGQWLYEIKLVTPQSRYLEIYIDARDKRIVKVEGK